MSLELGYAHPDYMLDELTSSQISEWEAYDKLEPVGQYRSDIMIASVCAQIHNLVLGLSKGNKKEARPMDFIPWHVAEEKFAKETAVKTPEQVRETLLGLFGGSEKKEDKD